MAVQAFIHDCACKMLRVKELPLDLRNYLDEVEMYANLVAGSISSRQIVAMALVNYMDRRAFLNKIDELEEKLKYDE
jgi:hypothetical protein|tara:strand:- start:57 stop:287 length:231 start_codon:yes stop_codon:yes gene_type:complete